MYRAGKHHAQTSKGRNPLWDTRVQDEKGDTIFIPVLDSAKYITEEFYLAMEVFATSENMGCLPFAGGWAEQPAWITNAIAVLKVERYNIDNEEREAKRQEEEDRRKYDKRQ